MGELIDMLKGKLKKVEGDLTGDRSKHAEGVIDEIKGDVKGAFEDVKHAVKKAVREADEEHERANDRDEESK